MNILYRNTTNSIDKRETTLYILSRFYGSIFPYTVQCIIFLRRWAWTCCIVVELYENLALKLYCGYKYNRPCMINLIWGLKQQWLQVNGHGWFHLQGLRSAVRNGNKRTIQNENMYPLGIDFLAGHQDRFAVWTVVKLRLKLYPNHVMNNTWQCDIYNWLWFCEFMQC